MKFGSRRGKGVHRTHNETKLEKKKTKERGDTKGALLWTEGG